MHTQMLCEMNSFTWLRGSMIWGLFLAVPSKNHGAMATPLALKECRHKKRMMCSMVTGGSATTKKKKVK
jgi:hypothetical protein